MVTTHKVLRAERIRQLLAEGHKIRKEIEKRLRPLKIISAKVRNLILK